MDVFKRIGICLQAIVLVVAANLIFGGEAKAAPPVMVGKTIYVYYDREVTVDLAALTTGDVISYSITAGPSYGNASLNGSVLAFTYPGSQSCCTFIDTVQVEAIGPDGSSTATVTFNAPAGPNGSGPSINDLNVTLEYNGGPVTVDLADSISGSGNQINVWGSSSLFTYAVSGTVITLTARAMLKSDPQEQRQQAKHTASPSMDHIIPQTSSWTASLATSTLNSTVFGI